MEMYFNPHVGHFQAIILRKINYSCMIKATGCFCFRWILCETSLLCFIQWLIENYSLTQLYDINNLTEHSWDKQFNCLYNKCYTKLYFSINYRLVFSDLSPCLKCIACCTWVLQFCSHWIMDLNVTLYDSDVNSIRKCYFPAEGIECALA
jgi:hypothetical protein